jgi:NADH-quinone oxidoreductase subunit J
MPVFFGFFLGLQLLFFSFLVVTVVNPVFSVMALVTVFLFVAGFFFCLDVDFIAVVFVMIYVGAIAVLFLFVVMMLDIKITSKGEDFFKYFPIGGFIGILFLYKVYPIILYNFPTNQIDCFSEPISLSWNSCLDKNSNILLLGQLLYANFFIYFLISGLVLLVSMVGSIVLTLSFGKTTKNQLAFKQSCRNKKSAVFLVTN